jgi:hypothetical protein
LKRSPRGREFVSIGGSGRGDGLDRDVAMLVRGGSMRFLGIFEYLTGAGAAATAAGGYAGFHLQCAK